MVYLIILVKLHVNLGPN